MKKRKSIHYPSLVQQKKHLKLKDMALALEYGQLENDRRVQLKMPSAVVKEIDKVFPDIDRSKLFTQLALQALYNRYLYQDRPDLESFAQQEQIELNQMWDYLEERDAS